MLNVAPLVLPLFPQQTLPSPHLAEDSSVRKKGGSDVGRGRREGDEASVDLLDFCQVSSILIPCARASRLQKDKHTLSFQSAHSFCTVFKFKYTPKDIYLLSHRSCSPVACPRLSNSIRHNVLFAKANTFGGLAILWTVYR